MAIDWELPIAKPDGTPMVLKAYIDDARQVIDLTDRPLDRDTKRHALQQFNAGVRYICHPDRNSAQITYYKADGSPWLDHHAPLNNVPGARRTLASRVRAAMDAEREREKLRQARRQMIEARRRGEDAIAEALIDQAQQFMEESPMWGIF